MSNGGGVVMMEHSITSDNAAAVGHPVGHVVSARVLVGVWASLLVMTVVTVLATRIDLGGPMNLWVAMAIATFKASLVLLYFMHLRYDHPVNAMVFIFALLFLALFIGGALTDAQQYQSELIPDYAPDMHK
jgi:cytochrome c oxidase subunit IV